MKLNPQLKGLADILIGVMLRETIQADDAAKDAPEDGPKSEDENDSQ